MVDEIDEEEIRRMLQPRRRLPQPVRKSRQWIVDRQDVAAFVFLVREAFPNIAFLVLEEPGDGWNKWKRIDDPVACSSTMYAHLVPDGVDIDAWCGQRQPYRSLTDRYFRFRHRSRPYPWTLKNGRSLENLVQSNIQGGHARSNREAAGFLRKVWRISDKLSTNRVMKVDIEAGRTTHPEINAGLLHFGFGALRWCQQNEDRVLESRYRPTEGWVMPDLPWYR